MDKGGKMFGKNYLENGNIRIAIGIMIFAALMSNVRAGDWPIFSNRDSMHKKSDIWMKEGLILVTLVLLTGIYIGIAGAVPTEEWNKTFGGKNNDYPGYVQQTSDGGYIIASGTESYGSGNEDIWLVKTDANGNQVWSNTFGGSNQDHPNSVQQTSDGGYIIAGFAYSFTVGRLSEAYLIKTDASGKEQWSKTFGGDLRDPLMSVQQTLDGGYIVAGWTESFGDSNGDVWLIKTNATGDQQWSKTFGGISVDYGRSVQQTLEGGYIVAGYTYSYGAGDSDAWLIKTNANGDQQWNWTFGGTLEDGANSVQQTQDGGYVVAGWTMSYAAGKYDAWLLKTDASGKEQWNKTFGGTLNDTVYYVQQTSDGGYIISGYTDSYGTGLKDIWVIKTDDKGNELWNKTFGGIRDDQALSIRQTLEGGYIIAGGTRSYGAGGWDTWLIKAGEARTYTFQTTNNSMQITVDGIMQMSPYNVSWIDGTIHNISVPDGQAIISGQSQYIFTLWNGMNTSTSSSISITANASTTGIYNANYKKQYYLTVDTDPTGLASISGEGWYDSGTTAATGIAQGTVGPLLFSTWNVDGINISGNPISVIMNAPHNATAIYLSSNVTSCRVISSPGEYVLTADIINSTYSTCIEITSSDVIFNGNGYTMDGVDGTNTYGVYVYNLDVSLTNVTVENLNITDWRSGIHYNNAKNGRIKNNNVSSNFIGIYLIGNSNYNTLTDNIVTLTPFGGYGIGIDNSHNNNLTINTVNENGGTGIVLENTSSNNILTDNNASSNGDIGIWLLGSSNYNTLTNNILAGNGFSGLGNGHTGILIETSRNNIVTANIVKDNMRGIVLYSSSNNILTNNNASDNQDWDFYSNSNSMGNNVIDLNIGSTISFTGKDIAIKSSLSPANDPPGYQNISKYINATNTNADSWLFLNISYSDSDIAGVRENTLSMWKYDGSSWSQVKGTNGVDAAQNYVYANITSFGILVPMGVEGIPPAGVTDLRNISYDSTNIIWTWIDPSDMDFASVNVSLDGVFKANIQKGIRLYTATGLISDTLHTISTRTVDINGNENQTWVTSIARTAISGTPIVINITSPQNNPSYNTTGNVSVTVAFDRPGTANLSWDGAIETMEPMDGGGMNYTKNKTGLLSGTFSFRVYASDSRGFSNVSETRVVTVDRTEIIDLSNYTDNVTGNISRNVTIQVPSTNAINPSSINIYNGTNITIDCETSKNISINSWDNLPNDYLEAWLKKYRFGGENLSFYPHCTRFIPDVQIRFNYTDEQLAGIDEDELTVKYFNNKTNEWEPVNITDRDNSSNYIVVNTSHFSMFVLAAPTPASYDRSTSNGGSNTGGGGVGGAGVITREPAANIEKYETKSSHIAKDTATTYKFTPLEGGIYEIVVVGKKTEGDISIRVEHLLGLSKLIKEPAPETVYYYVNIWSGTEDITEALIRFKVEKSWIASQNLANDGMKMLKWDGSKWRQLDTVKIKEDATHTYYEARSNSLSQLAVVGEKPAVSPATPKAVTSSTSIPPTAAPTGAPIRESPQINLNYILVAFAIILGVIIMMLGVVAAPTMKSISSGQFIGKSPEEYGEKYHEHLLEQYKLYVNMADRAIERWQSTNNYFILFNSILVSIFGVLAGFESMAKQHMWQYLLLFAGFLVSIIWGTLIGSSRQLNSVKLTLIHEVESRLPAALYNSEWNILGESKRRLYLPFTYMEQFVPWIFAGLYILLIIMTLWNLSN